MKQGPTTLSRTTNGFYPVVEVGNDDGAVNVCIGPVWVRIRAVAPGESYDVSVQIDGIVTDKPIQSYSRIELAVKAEPGAIRKWERSEPKAAES